MFLRDEKAVRSERVKVIAGAKQNIVQDFVLGYGLIGATLGFVVGFVAACHPSQFSLDVGMLLTTTLLLGVVGCFVGHAQGSATEPKTE